MKLLFKIKACYYFWMVSVLILLIGIIRRDEIIDLNIHDTYFVIENSHLTLLLCNAYFFLGAGYWFVENTLRKKLIRPLTLVHSVILIGGFISYWLVFLYYQLKPKGQFPLLDDGSDVIASTLFTLFFLIVLIAQPVYVINLVVGICGKRQA